ncbi:MAG TPA: ABC transporter permease [Vicinamibacterales bacterium]
MSWHQAIRARLGSITGDPSLDLDVVDELAGHLADSYAAARASGMDHDRAEELALDELKDPATLEHALRIARSRRSTAAPSPGVAVDDLAGVLRRAVRLLAASPGFTLAALLMLAAGIGGATAIFSVVDAVLLRPLPYPHADRLVAVWETDRHSSTVREPASLPDFLDLERDARAFDALGAIVAGEFTLAPPGGEPRRLAGLSITQQLLPMLGVTPVTGRLFDAAEHRRSQADTALISERLWRTAFEADPAVIGRVIHIDDRPRTVVGVLPDHADVGMLQWLSSADYSRGFADRDARTRVDLWLPLPLDVQALPRSTHPLLVLGRLRDGVAPDAAERELSGIMVALERAYPENEARGARLEPFTDVVLGPARPGLTALLLAVGLLLVAACVNVAHLLLVRGLARRREMAVRVALGGSLSRLGLQFLIENGVLVAAGGLLGVGAAFAGVRGLIALAPADVPRLADVGVDARALGIALTLMLAVAVVFGLLPLLQVRRLDVQRALAGDGARSAGADASRTRLRSGLVVTEVALAVVLAVGAGLMVRSLVRLQQVDPGFDAAHVLKAEFQLPESRYPRSFRTWPRWTEIHQFTGGLLARLEALPGVTGAAIAAQHPLDAGFTNSFAVVGRETEAKDWPEIATRIVSPGYFGTVGLGLVRGRALGPGDHADAPLVLLINEAAARQFFEGRDPLGARITIWGMPRTIVGVVANERFRGLDQAPPPAVYLPIAQNPLAGGVVLVRGPDPAALTGSVRAVIREQDPQLAVFGLQPLTLTLRESLGRPRFVMRVLVAFAVLALLLAAAGLYAVLSCEVRQRTREIGIRLALGAPPARIVREITSRAARLTMLGLAAGIAASAALTGLLRSLLYEVAPTDLPTFAGVALLLLAAAIAAAAVPARQASRTDPAISLRTE